MASIIPEDAASLAPVKTIEATAMAVLWKNTNSQTPADFRGRNARRKKNPEKMRNPNRRQVSTHTISGPAPLAAGMAEKNAASALKPASNINDRPSRSTHGLENELLLFESIQSPQKREKFESSLISA
jgi:hypothetical protein